MSLPESNNFNLYAYHNSPTTSVSLPLVYLIPELSQENSQELDQAPTPLGPVQSLNSPLKSAIQRNERMTSPKQVHWDSEIVDNEYKMQSRRRVTGTCPSVPRSSNPHSLSTEIRSFARPFQQAPEVLSSPPSKRQRSIQHQSSQMAGSLSIDSGKDSLSRRSHSPRHQQSHSANTGARRDAASAHSNVEVRPRTASYSGSAGSHAYFHNQNQIPPRVPNAPKRDSGTPLLSPKSPRTPKLSHVERKNKVTIISPIRILDSKARQPEDPVSFVFPELHHYVETEAVFIENSKPPPTPRPRRLPSPDLPEIECGGFCGCCKTQAPYYSPGSQHHDYNPQKWEYQLENALAYIKGGKKS